MRSRIVPRARRSRANRAQIIEVDRDLGGNDVVRLPAADVRRAGGVVQLRAVRVGRLQERREHLATPPVVSRAPRPQTYREQRPRPAADGGATSALPERWRTLPYART